jgi:hypothetical protein
MDPSGNNTVGWEKVAIASGTILAIFMGWIFSLMVEQNRVYNSRILIDALDIQELKGTTEDLERRVEELEEFQEKQWRELHCSTVGTYPMLEPTR